MLWMILALATVRYGVRALVDWCGAWVRPAYFVMRAEDRYP